MPRRLLLGKTDSTCLSSHTQKLKVFWFMSEEINRTSRHGGAEANTRESWQEYSLFNSFFRRGMAVKAKNRLLSTLVPVLSRELSNDLPRGKVNKVSRQKREVFQAPYKENQCIQRFFDPTHPGSTSRFLLDSVSWQDFNLFSETFIVNKRLKRIPLIRLTKLRVKQACVQTSR